MTFKRFQYPWLTSWQKNFRRRWQPIAESPDYHAWRDRFILNRYKVCLWIALVYTIICFAIVIYLLFINPQQMMDDATQILGDPTLFERLQSFSLISCSAQIGLLIILSTLWRSRWGKHHPVFLFLLLAWSFSVISSNVIGTFFWIPNTPDIILFMALVILMPVHWRMHVFAQLPSWIYFFIIYPLIGLTKLGTRPIYEPTIISQSLLIGCVCVMSVYLYERLKLSEFEAQRRVNVFIRSIAHDLRTPIMGTVMLLQSLRQSAYQGKATLTLADIDQLLDGNDRLLGLMNSLLDVHLPGNPELIVKTQPIAFKSLMDAVLLDLQSSIQKNRVQLSNQIPEHLPMIEADPQLLWRVLYNLLSNAWKHNPPGIHLNIEAAVVNHKLRCTIQDNGIGIPKSQIATLFELYTRGENAQYLPGLGLGLFVCRQILLAHNGSIGAISTPGQGTTFWFTLPLVEPPPLLESGIGNHWKSL